MSALISKEREIQSKVKNFLENLKPEDRIGLVFHDDLDGFASGRLFYEFLIKKECKNIEIGVFRIGKNNPFGSEEIKKCNKLIVLDLAQDLVVDYLVNDKRPILYIDHHKKGNDKNLDNVIELREQGYIPVSKTCYKILEGFVLDFDWVSLAGVLFDKGDLYPENQEFIDNILKKYNFFLEDFNQQIVYVTTNLIIYFEDNLKKAFLIFLEINRIEDIKNIIKYSEPIEREIERFVSLYEKKSETINGIHFFYFEPKFKIKSIVTSKISLEDPQGVFIFATPSENTISFSSRCQSRKVDVAEIMKKLIFGFKDSTSGGHAAAAGGVIRKEDFPQFMERLKYFNRGL